MLLLFCAGHVELTWQWRESNLFLTRASCRLFLHWKKVTIKQEIVTAVLYLNWSFLGASRHILTWPLACFPQSHSFALCEMSRTSNSCSVYSLACGICGLLGVSQIYNYIVKVTQERQAFLFPVAFPRNGCSFGRGLWPTEEESSASGRESKLSVAIESLSQLVSKCRDRWMDGRLCYSYREASESICLPGRVYYSLSGLQWVITLL